MSVGALRRRDEVASRLAEELDRLTEAAVVVRLIVKDDALLTAVEDFEVRAKRIEDRAADPGVRLELTALISAIQRFEESQAEPQGHSE